MDPGQWPSTIQGSIKISGRRERTAGRRSSPEALGQRRRIGYSRGEQPPGRATKMRTIHWTERSQGFDEDEFGMQGSDWFSQAISAQY